MGTNVMADFFKNQEDRNQAQQVEQLRRKGHKFIRVRYAGSVIPAVDAEGIAYNLRIHGLRDVEAFERTNINDGRVDWDSRPGARALAFRQVASGDIEAEIWDDPDAYNRHFIATHPELAVLDPIVAKEIADLDPKTFKAELSDEEVLKRDIETKQKQLTAMKAQRAKETEKKVEKKVSPKPEPTGLSIE